MCNTIKVGSFADKKARGEKGMDHHQVIEDDFIMSPPLEDDPARPD